MVASDVQRGDDLEALGRAEAWPLERLLALEGRCRGGLFAHWADNVRRRFGAGEADAMRAALGVTARDLPDMPDKEAWLPIGWQLGLTRLLVDRHLDGDVLRLERLVHEDALRHKPPERLVDKLAKKVLTPKRLLGAAGKVYPHVYDLGRVEADVGKAVTVLRWSGAGFMAEPLWRVLQVFAVRGMYTALERPLPECRAAAAAAASFELRIATS